MFSASDHIVLPEAFIPELLAAIVRSMEPPILYALKQIVDERVAHFIPEASTSHRHGRKETKLRINSNVEQLGLALKLMMDSEVLLVRNRSEVSQFFANHFRTRKTEHISTEHLRNCYYRQEPKTVRDLKGLLFGWLGRLRDIERSM
jgi:hypothetical protein